MGKKDLWQSDYFENKERFADMFNGTLFQGKQVMKAEELVETDPKLIHHLGKKEVVNVIRDKAFVWQGQQFCVCILENQSYVDYRMVFRIMLEEALSYIRQQKQAYEALVREGYKFTKNEYLSRMRKQEKYAPVVTLVLYLGKDRIWDGARQLYDLLEIQEEWKPFVSNYKINVFDYHDQKDFSQFQTENRFLFTLLSCAGEEKRMEGVLREYLGNRLLDEEAAKAIFGMLDIRMDIEKFWRKEEKEEGYSMCKAWDDHKERGRREGRQEGLEEGLQLGKQKGLQEGCQSLIHSLKKLLPDVEAVYQAVIENEVYKDVTREQVKKYYCGK